MRDTLRAGMTHRIVYKVPENKTVPHLYPEAELFQTMPKVFATGYMVGLFEWACTEFLAQHLDASEGSLGTHVDFAHKAATPPGLTVTVDAECLEVKGARVRFRVTGHDGVEEIGGGLHERYVVKRADFDARVAAKRAKAGVAA